VLRAELGPGKLSALQLPLRAPGGSPEFLSLVSELERRGAGAAPVVAEAFLAATHRGAVPRFSTTDPELITQLGPGNRLSDGATEVRVLTYALRVISVGGSN
jgi:hypothetical protein